MGTSTLALLVLCVVVGVILWRVGSIPARLGTWLRARRRRKMEDAIIEEKLRRARAEADKAEEDMHDRNADKLFGKGWKDKVATYLISKADKRDRRGVTLVEFLIIAAIVGILALMIFGNLSSPSDDQMANKAAMHFAVQAHGDDVKSVTCVDVDSDNDGYISCTAFIANQPPLAMECRYRAPSGCRMATGKSFDN